MKRLLQLSSFLILSVSSFYSISQTVNYRTSYSGGNNFSSVLCSDGRVFSAGYNGQGQLGNGTTATGVAGINNNWIVNPTLPTNIAELNARSGSHTLALGCNGIVYAWGGDGCGQLGRNNGVVATNCDQVATTYGSVPRFVSGIGGTGTLTGVAGVAGGNQHSLGILTVTGEVVAWGGNQSSSSTDNGMLGDGTNTNRSYPDYVLTATGSRLRNVVQVSAGDYNSYALDASGRVWSWGSTDGSNALGRTVTGTQNRFAGLVQQCSPAQTLNNIIKIAAGDRHLLALDNNGNVWTIGGDWGQGQRGSGGPYNAQNCATRVVAPGCSGCDAGQSSFNGPFLSNVIDITGAQASSAAVLQDGRVVTWGSNGFFTDPSFAFVYGGSGCGGTSNYVASGNAGNGSPANGNCGPIPAGTGNGTPAGNGGNKVPVFVMTNATTTLTGIQSISGGDSWFFAQNANGSILGWGNNSLGVLGTGDLLDRNYATPLLNTISCAVVQPCATKPSLGADQSFCIPFSSTLSVTNFVGGTNNNIYAWDFRSSTSAGWTFLSSGTGPSFSSLNISSVGQYRLRLLDRPGIFFPTFCGTCPTQMDTITVNTFPNPAFAAGPSSICSTVAGTGIFSITTTAGGGSYFWYTNTSGGTALSTTPGMTISGISLAQTSTLAGCSGRVLYVQDQGSFTGTLNSGSLTSPYATQLCSSGYSGTVSNGTSTPMLIIPSVSLSLNSVDIILPGQSYGQTFNLTFQVLSDAALAGTINCNSGGCSNIKFGPGGVIMTSTGTVTLAANAPTQAYTFSLSGINLTANTKYWIQVNSSIQLGLWSSCSLPTASTGCTNPCGFATLWDNSTRNALGVTNIAYQGNPNSNYGSHMMNIKFTAGNVSTCSRVPVCAGINCPLNVTYANFTGTKINEGILLRWTTLSESNSSHFVIEKSTDGVSFVAIGKVKAKGNSNGWVDYSFLDKSYNKGTVYYRLVQYDLDNSYFVSNTVAVNVTPLSDFQVIPNPNNGTFAVKASFNTSTVFEIKINDAVGHLIYANVEDGAGDFNKEFNLNTLAPGVYFISLKADETYLVKKIIIE